MDYYRTIRKLRKKLRQIEHLESIDRDLNDEEVAKCMKKESIREELLELLVEYNSQGQTDESKTDLNSSTATSGTDVNISQPTAIVESGVAETLESDSHTYTSTEFENTNNSNSPEELQLESSPDKGSLLPEKHNPVVNGQGSSGEGQRSEDDGSRSDTASSRAKAESSQTPSPSKKAKVKKGVKDTSLRAEWSRKAFAVSVLESHSDLVTAVDCSNQVLVSASRDTTVKVWDLNTLRELRSLGSHTGSVTDVVVLPGKLAQKIGASIQVCEDDNIILSGSADCSLNVWSANTGELLKSIYTYNPITKLVFYPDLYLVITGSDGGKLELWNIDTKENVCSERAHSDSITGLCVSDGRIYTSCAVDGEIKVFEVRDSKLHCVYASEKIVSVTGDAVAMRHVRSLGVKGEVIYFGDDGINLKCLRWRKGQVSKLANHKNDFGMTDAICSHGNLMVTSAYDLDNGHGYLNVFDLTGEPSYIATLDCEETQRILDVCCYDNKNDITIVTAGLDLQVWRQVSSDRCDDEAVRTKFFTSLSEPAQDSDIESDVEFTDSESEEGSRKGSRRGSRQIEGSSWLSWCTLT